jgi:hypothetical protein
MGIPVINLDDDQIAGLKKKPILKNHRQSLIHREYHKIIAVPNMAQIMSEDVKAHDRPGLGAGWSTASAF